MGESTANLVLAAAKGDQLAWNALVDSHARLVWSVIRSHRLRPADAGDAFQTTWLRLVENLTALRQPERLASWLVTTARRECLRLQQHRQREVPDPEVTDRGEITDSALPGPEAAVLDDERRVGVARAFARLPQRCQLLLRLWLAEPRMEYSEIAADLGVPIGSLGPTRSRCLEHLRRLLTDETPSTH